MLIIYMYNFFFSYHGFEGKRKEKYLYFQIQIFQEIWWWIQTRVRMSVQRKLVYTRTAKQVQWSPVFPFFYLNGLFGTEIWTFKPEAFQVLQYYFVGNIGVGRVEKKGGRLAPFSSYKWWKRHVIRCGKLSKRGSAHFSLGKDCWILWRNWHGFSRDGRKERGGMGVGES